MLAPRRVIWPKPAGERVVFCSASAKGSDDLRVLNGGIPSRISLNSSGEERLVEATFDAEKLKKLYKNNETARIFLDHAAKRKQNRSKTRIHAILSALKAESHEVLRGEMVAVFQLLQDAGCGRRLLGRWDSPTRFVWEQISMINAGRIAAGEPPIDELADGESDEDAEMLQHTFHLRSDRQITLELPSDLTQSEATRLAMFIKALPWETDEK